MDGRLLAFCWRNLFRDGVAIHLFANGELCID